MTICGRATRAIAIASMAQEHLTGDKQPREKEGQRYPMCCLLLDALSPRRWSWPFFGSTPTNEARREMDDEII